MSQPLRVSVYNLILKLGYEVRRTSPRNGGPYRKNLLYESDELFHRLRNQGLSKTGSPDGGLKSIEKLYNTLQFLSLVMHKAGDCAECGCFKGLSAYVFCEYLKLNDPSFTGNGFHIFDSFEGLSAPTAADRILDPKVANIGEAHRSKGAYRGELEHVRRALNDFPEINMVPGWIPESLKGLPEKKYRFVHVDVDLYEPTLGAIEYFYPRLIPGGIIVCDDYGFLHWPGARKAVDEYCARSNVPVIALTTGQGVIQKPLD